MTTHASPEKKKHARASEEEEQEQEWDAIHAAIACLLAPHTTVPADAYIASAVSGTGNKDLPLPAGTADASFFLCEVAKIEQRASTRVATERELSCFTEPYTNARFVDGAAFRAAMAPLLRIRAALLVARTAARARAALTKPPNKRALLIAPAPHEPA